MMLNVNVSVTATLTDAGKKRVETFYRELGLPQHRALRCEGKVFKTQLWELMSIFGPEMHMGNRDVMFENNSVDIDLK